MRDDEIYEYLSGSFEWNRAKAKSNWSKHKVLFTEAVTVFFDPSYVLITDAEHSLDEPHLAVIGYSVRQRKLLVVHVERGKRVRIISAREVTPRERKFYES